MVGYIGFLRSRKVDNLSSDAKCLAAYVLATDYGGYGLATEMTFQCLKW